MSLKYRIAATIFVFEAVLVAVLLWVTLSYSMGSVREQVTASEDVSFQLIGDLSRSALLTEDYAEMQSFVDATVNDPRIVTVVLADRRGRVVVATEADFIGAPLPSLSNDHHGYWRTKQVEGYTNALGTLAIEFSDHALLTAYRDARNLGLAIAIAGMICIAVVGILIGFVLTRRLQALADAAAHVGAGGDGFEFEIQGRDEVARLARVFTGMLQRLRYNMEELKRARDMLIEPTEAMSQGFALWDANDRLVLCNSRFRELLQGIDDGIVTGMRFSQLVTRLQVLIQLHGGDMQSFREWLAKRLAEGVSPQVVGEIQLMPQRWIEFRESRTRDRGLVAICTDISDRKAAEQKILYHATHDTLTGLPNRTLFDDRLDTALKHARRAPESLAVMFMDVDRFKVVNDMLGHAVGDALLAAIAQRILGELRAGDTMSRMGGDEFLFLLRDVAGFEHAIATGQRIVDAVRSEPFHVMGHEVGVTISLGISMFPLNGRTPDQLLKHADIALYGAKSGGRSQVRMFDPAMSAESDRQGTIETDLKTALAQRQFHLLYQPQVDLGSGRMVGVEALLRWLHPELGFIPPSEFIPIAEATGAIHVLGGWVLREACRQWRRWATISPAPLRLAVNLSPRQFQDPALAEQITTTMSELRVDKASVELELTETVLMHEGDNTARQIRALDEMGVGLVLDDFGTGYSSLSHLKRFPIRRIKIDRSFVADIEHNANGAALVRATAAIAQCMGIGLIAEGVETPGQMAMLRSFGCGEGQGFLTGHPVDAEEISRMLRDGSMQRLAGERGIAANRPTGTPSLKLVT